MVKTAVVILTAAVIVALLGTWLACRTVAFALTLAFWRHGLLAPHFTEIILPQHNLILLFMVVWLAATAALWTRITSRVERVLAYGSVALLLIVVTVTLAVLACILPWLPHGGPFLPLRP